VQQATPLQAKEPSKRNTTGRLRLVDLVFFVLFVPGGGEKDSLELTLLLVSEQAASLPVDGIVACGVWVLFLRRR